MRPENCQRRLAENLLMGVPKKLSVLIALVEIRPDHAMVRNGIPSTEIWA